MAKRSAGLLLYRHRAGTTEVLLVHPGGPFWAKKDEGAWSIPKGEYEAGENPLAAARREFEEETGAGIDGDFVHLGSFRQSSAKTVDAWAVQRDFEPSKLQSGTFSVEWPPRSGRMRDFPEVDRASWFGPHEAERKILRGQQPILAALYQRLRKEDG